MLCMRVAYKVAALIAVRDFPSTFAPLPVDTRVLRKTHVFYFSQRIYRPPLSVCAALSQATPSQMKKRPCGMGALRVDEHRTTKQCECGVHYEHRRASAAELIGSQAAREPPVQSAPTPQVCAKCAVAFATAECLEAHLSAAHP